MNNEINNVNIEDAVIHPVNPIDKLYYRNKTEGLIEELGKKFFERDEVLRLLLLALLSKQHIFLIGLPGTGKSALIKALSRVIFDATYWTILVSNDTKEKQFFGEPVTLEDGTISHDFTNTMLDAHLVFIDEMFKTKSEVLNAHLEVMEDRTYSFMGKSIPTKLYTLVGASNELPEGNLIAPFVDRLLIWYDVLRIQNDDNFIKLLKGEFDTNEKIHNTFSLHEIDEIVKRSKTVSVSSVFIEKLMLVKEAIHKANTQARGSINGVSDRKYFNIMKALKCAAVINGDDELNESYIFFLVHMTWRTYSEKKRFKDAIYFTMFGHQNEIQKYIKWIEDEIEKIASELNSVGRFLNFSTPFSRTNQLATYDDLYRRISHIFEVSTEVNKLVQTLYGKYQYNIYLEKLIASNILLPDLKSDVFSQELVKDLMNVKFTIENHLKKLEVWLSENKTVSQYNLHATSFTAPLIAAN